ncbi:MAG: hypothetical protein M3T56_09585 [Chloroflexota bacterium]|nr:hypothetical protein [Chloroflexota bacterium]
MTGLWLLAFVLQWILIALIILVMAGILRYLAILQERIGQAIPHVTRFAKDESATSFTLPDLDGHPYEFRPQSIGRQTLLLILTTHCGTCEVVLRQAVEIAQRPKGLATIGWSMVIVAFGDQRSVKELLERSLSGVDLALPSSVPILVDEQGVVLRGYLVGSAPAGVALDALGRVIDQSANPGPNWIYQVLNVPAPDKALLPPAWIGQIS